MTAVQDKETVRRDIQDECVRQGLSLPAQIAYVLATVEHETMGTFRPVKECFWMKDPDAYLKKHHPEYYPYYGRGYVQITHRENYEKFSRLLGRDLVNHPDIALEHEVAKFTLVYGFKHGIFTGRKLVDYVNPSRTDFINARRCINGSDRAVHISGLARNYLEDPRYA